MSRRILFIFLFAATGWTQAEQPWPDKDGPTFNGIVPSLSAEALPLEWDVATGKHITWKTPLTGFGHSSPIVAHGQLWFTAATKDGTEQFIYAVDALSGTIVHHKRLFVNENPEPLGNKVNTYASPSCVADDAAIYAHCGTYGTARLDPKSGETVWERRDIQCRHFRGPGSSPIVFNNLLVLTFDGIDAQFIIALDKNTGETVWRTDRTTDYEDLDAEGKPQRDGDLRKAYSTPAVFRIGTVPHLVSVGSRAAFGYDARTGEELWTITHKGFNAAVRPLFHAGYMYLNTGSSRSALLAVKTDDAMAGNIDASHVVWRRKKRNGRFARPIITDGRIFQLTDASIVACADLATGKDIWSERLEGKYMASPLLAGDKIYFFSLQGKTTVLRAGGRYEELGRGNLGEAISATPAVAGGAIFIRAEQHLFKIESKIESSE